VIKEKYWEIFKKEDEEIVAAWKGATSSDAITDAAKALGVKDKKVAFKKYSARPLREDSNNDHVAVKRNDIKI
jgi:hypothetical protein